MSNRFANSKGIVRISEILTEANERLADKTELVDKILIFLNKITLTPDILEKTKLHLQIETVKNSSEIPSELVNKAFKLLAKWRKPVEDWMAQRKMDLETNGVQNANGSPSDQDHETQEIDREDDDREHEYAPRNFIKRTRERNNERPIYRENERDFRNHDPKRKGRIFGDRGVGVERRGDRRREGSPFRPTRPRFRFDRDNQNARWPRRRHDSMNSSDDDRSPRKSVK